MERRFTQEIGLDRVYPPGTALDAQIRDLEADIAERRRAWAAAEGQPA